MNHSIVVVAEQGAGKSQAAAELMRALGARRVLDGWAGEELQAGDLALTNVWPAKCPAGAVCMNLETALAYQAAA